VSCLAITRLCVCALVRTTGPLGHPPGPLAYGGEREDLFPGVPHAPTTTGYRTFGDAAQEQFVIVNREWSAQYPGHAPAHPYLFISRMPIMDLIGHVLYTQLVCPVCEIDSPLCACHSPCVLYSVRTTIHCVNVNKLCVCV